MQAIIEANRQDSGEKMKNPTEGLTAIITSMMDQINMSKSSPYHNFYQRLRILPLWYLLTICPNNWKVDIQQKLVACGLSNMRSDHQNSINSSSRQNSKTTLLWTSITSTTTSRCVSMRCIELEKTFFLVTSPSKYNLVLNNT